MLSLYPIKHSLAVVLLKQALTVEFQIVQLHILQSGSRSNFRVDQSIEHNYSRFYGKDALGKFMCFELSTSIIIEQIKLTPARKW
jgi:hypothetical protein